MRGGPAVEDPVDAELRRRLVEILEQAPAAPEHHRRQCDLEFVDHAQVQLLLDDACSNIRLPMMLAPVRSSVWRTLSLTAPGCSA